MNDISELHLDGEYMAKLFPKCKGNSCPKSPRIDTLCHQEKKAGNVTIADEESSIHPEYGCKASDLSVINGLPVYRSPDVESDDRASSSVEMSNDEDSERAAKKHAQPLQQRQRKLHKIYHQCRLRDSRIGDGKKSENLHSEIIETVFSAEVKSLKHTRDPLGVNGSVIFDDIGDDWRSDMNSIMSQNGALHDIITPSRNLYMEPNMEVVSEVADGADHKLNLIGKLAIAEYDGSPRRYGDRQADNSMPSVMSSPTDTPRPGFPKRIVAEDTDTAPSSAPHSSSSSFNYIYEYSQTRKVLEEFFKPEDLESKAAHFQELKYELKRRLSSEMHVEEGSSYVGMRLSKALDDNGSLAEDFRKGCLCGSSSSILDDEYAVSAIHEGSFPSSKRSSSEALGLPMEYEHRGSEILRFHQPRGRVDLTFSPETTDCESNMDSSDISSLMLAMDPDGGGHGDHNYLCMPVLEDGLSSGHNSDNEAAALMLMKKQMGDSEPNRKREIGFQEKMDNHNKQSKQAVKTTDLNTLDPLNSSNLEREGISPPPPAPTPHRETKFHAINTDSVKQETSEGVEAAIKDIRMTLQRTKTLPLRPACMTTLNGNGDGIGLKEGGKESSQRNEMPVWVPRLKGNCSGPSADEEEADTDLETDRLLGQQRTEDQGFFDDKTGWKKKSRSLLPFGLGGQVGTAIVTPMQTKICDTDAKINGHSPTRDSPPSSPSIYELSDSSNKKKECENSTNQNRNREGGYDASVLIEGVLFRARYLGSTQLICEGQPTKATRMMQAEEAVSRIKVDGGNRDGHHVGCEKGIYMDDDDDPGDDSSSLGPGTLFRLRFLGSVEVDEEEPLKRKPSIMKKRLKKNMVEEAVRKIKAPDGENQPGTDVDLFISTEKIMVLNTDLKEIMMDHALRTISYIADIGDLVVLMARRRFVPREMEESLKLNRTPKMICHVFESDEAQFIAQSIGQAFQVAYMEFLKANGIEDHSFVKEMDYQEVLNSQEIFGDELQMFAKKELQKEVVVPKMKGEILGVVIVESGWGSLLPTVVIANLAPAGAAARCGQLNIGDQIIAVNGVSLVGLPLSTCQNYIKNSKPHTVIKLTVVPCAPVVEVKIKRPDTKYQLGFSVQNGVICSLLRGGIAERGGVRVGHRIIEINNQSVVAVPHEKIVTLLATSVGEILMKTMPTSMFRLLTGQETPVFI